jgi:RNA polymerase sigma factor (sigma-70 family)
MAGGLASAHALNQLGRVFRFGVVGDLKDSQLLQRFLTGRDGADQAAFSALVERHGPMVLRVCRQVLGNPHDAQDAFQATFLVLARKAGSVRDAESLASWLHGIALRVAMRARANESLRKVHERRCATMREKEWESKAVVVESHPELHEEIARLPRRFRELVVLCYLEGLTSEEAALRIGCPPGTVWSRLSRAREHLRRSLVRRGVAFPAALMAAGLSPPASATVPATLLDATLRLSFIFAGRSATEAAMACGPALSLARGMLYTMTMSYVKILSAAALTCALALGAAQSLTWGQSGELRERHKLAPATAQAAAARPADEPSRSVARLADVLKRHPARRVPKEGDRLRLYMMDLVEGGTTLIADEAEPGSNWCNTPKWSHDGTRIIFATWPLPGFESCRIKAIEVKEGLPSLVDLGPGNSPTLSPDDKRIVFALEHGSVRGAESGAWVMQADGSGRRRMGEYAGAPFWSPDGREFLLCDYSDRCIVINLETKEESVLEVPGQRIFSWPSWAGPGTLVSALATEREGDSIALLDVSKPAEVKIIEVLWKRGEDLDVTPRWPVYRADTRRCCFVGVEPMKRTLLWFQRGESGRVKRLEPQGYDDMLGGLSFSPDGRYLLFCANRP